MVLGNLSNAQWSILNASPEELTRSQLGDKRKQATNPWEELATDAQTPEFASAVSGGVTHIQRVVQRVMTASDYLATSVLAPLAPMPENGRLRITQIDFKGASLSPLPRFGTVQMMQETFAEYQTAADTWGLGFMVEGGLMDTFLGEVFVSAGIRRISNGVSDNVTLKTFHELLHVDQHPLWLKSNAGRNPIKLALGLPESASLEEVMRVQKETWNCLGWRRAGVFLDLLTRSRTILKHRGVEPNTVVVPEGLQSTLRLKEDAIQIDGFKDTPAVYTRLGLVGKASGMGIFEAPLLTFSNMPDRTDMLVCHRAIGENHPMRSKYSTLYSKAQYNHALRTVTIYDHKRDIMVPVTLHEAIRYCGLFNPGSLTLTRIGQAFFTGFADFRQYREHLPQDMRDQLAKYGEELSSFQASDVYKKFSPGSGPAVTYGRGASGYKPRGSVSGSSSSGLDLLGAGDDASSSSAGTGAVPPRYTWTFDDAKDAKQPTVAAPTTAVARAIEADGVPDVGVVKTALTTRLPADLAQLRWKFRTPEMQLAAQESNPRYGDALDDLLSGVAQKTVVTSSGFYSRYAAKASAADRNVPPTYKRLNTYVTDVYAGTRRALAGSGLEAKGNLMLTKLIQSANTAKQTGAQEAVYAHLRRVGDMDTLHAIVQKVSDDTSVSSRALAGAADVKVSDVNAELDTIISRQTVSKEGDLDALKPEYFGPLFMFMVNNGIPLPLDFLLVRAAITNRMGSLLMLRAGAETATSHLGSANMSKQFDGNNRFMIMRFQIDTLVAVKDPKAVLVRHDVIDRGHVGGGQVEFWDPSNPADKQAFSMGDINRKGILVFPLHCSEKIGDMVDLTGMFSKQILSLDPRAAENYRQPIIARAVAEHWGVQGHFEAFDFKFWSQVNGHRNTLTHRAPTYLSGMKDGAVTEYFGVLEGTGHWGKRSWSGMATQRLGQAFGVPDPRLATLTVAETCPALMG